MMVLVEVSATVESLMESEVRNTVKRQRQRWVSVGGWAAMAAGWGGG